MKSGNSPDSCLFTQSLRVTNLWMSACCAGRRLQLCLLSEQLRTSVPLTHHDPKYLGLICLAQKHKILFLGFFREFKNPILDFLKEMNPTRSYPDIATRARFSIRATGLYDSFGLEFSLKRVLLSKMKNVYTTLNIAT